MCFVISFTSGPHSVRPLHHDSPVLHCPAGMAWFHCVRQGCGPSMIRLTSVRWVWFQCVCPLMPSCNTYHLTWVIGDWNVKVGSQETPGVTGKFGFGVWNEAGQRLIEFYQENALVIANTLFQQHKRRLYTWTSPDGQHRNQIDYILCTQRWRSSIQSAKTRPGADCASQEAFAWINLPD